MYQNAVQKSKLENLDEIERISHFFKNNKIDIIKLNQSLAESSTSTEFDAILQLSQDGGYFQITNKIPLIDAYLRTADDTLIQIEKKKIKDERVHKMVQERGGKT